MRVLEDQAADTKAGPRDAKPEIEIGEASTSYAAGTDLVRRIEHPAELSNVHHQQKKSIFSFPFVSWDKC